MGIAALHPSYNQIRTISYLGMMGIATLNPSYKGRCYRAAEATTRNGIAGPAPGRAAMPALAT